MSLAGEPDLEVNPLTGFPEAVDTDAAQGDLVRHVEDQGQGGPRTTTLISAGAGTSPRIAIRSTGHSWVVWWSDGSTDEVRYRYLDPTTKVWSTEAVLSASGEDGRNPEVVHNGDDTWVAYEAPDGTTVSIMTAGIVDDPQPFETPREVATTTFSGEVDVLVHSSSGHVWVTWVDSSTHVGWGEYDYATDTWGTPQYESYAGSTVALVRKDIGLAIVN